MKYRDIILLISASATLLLVKSGSVCQGNHPTTTDNLPKAASKKLRYDLLPNFHRVDLGAPPSADATCMLWQECKGRQGFFGRDMKTTTCRTDGGAPQADDILNPAIRYYQPVPIYKPAQKDQLKKNCPYLNVDEVHCCNDD